MRALTPDTAVGRPLADLYEHAAARLAAVSQNAVEPADVVLAQAPEHTGADLAFACFPLAKAWRRNPAQIAGEMAEELNESLGDDDPWLDRGEAAGPYLNLYLRRDRTIGAVLRQVDGEQEVYGRSTRQQGQRVMMEYVSPNTNKPLHLGHIRNAVLGRAVANLVQSQGAEVFRTDIINDRGIHIAKSMVAYRRWAEGATPESTGTKGDHFVGTYYVKFDQALRDERQAWLEQQDEDPSALDERGKKKLEERFLAASELMAEARDVLQKWEADDEEVRALWRKMNGWVYDGFESTYERLGIDFDKHYYESDIYQGGKELIQDAVERGVFETADNGAVVAPLSKHPELGKNLQDKVVQRADGTGLYITQDMNLATIKFQDFDLDRSIYCIGSEQNYYMQQLIATLRLLGFEWADGVFHLSYGMVYLPEGKMKSREGTVVDADDLMAELASMAKEAILERSPDVPDDELAARAEAIGLAAIVFNFLLVGRETDIHFDPASSLSFEGKTGPYLQYTYARMSSLLSKAGDWQAPAEVDIGAKLEHEAEWRVAADLLYLPSVVADAAESYDPSRLAAHLYDAAQHINVFWHEVPVLTADEPERSSRLALVQAARTALGNGMRLLAVEPIEEM